MNATAANAHTDFADEALDWAKGNDLLPVIVQHWRTGAVLMLGYMNADALAATHASGLVTFFSRSRQRLWQKGETSGHVLHVKSIRTDCDRDTLLIAADPHGPTCHLGTASCFGDGSQPPLAFLAELDTLVARRAAERPANSYTVKLLDSGVRRIAQKVGEEGVETALAAVAQDDVEFVGEAADLVYHLTVLLRARGLSLADVAETLAGRHAGMPAPAPPRATRVTRKPAGAWASRPLPAAQPPAAPAADAPDHHEARTHA